MSRYRVTFHALQPVRRSVFVDDELDELDQQDIEQDAWFSLRDYLMANGEEPSGWEDPEVEKID